MIKFVKSTLFALPLALCLAAPLQMQAATIQLGTSLDTFTPLTGLTILDQTLLDLNQTVDAVGVQQILRGFSLTGTVLALTPDPLDPTVRFQNLTIQCTNTLQGCGAVPLTFFGTFSQANAIANGVAFSGLQGTFSNPNGLGTGAMIDFQGFANGVPIGSLFTFNAPAGAASVNFNGKNVIPFPTLPGLLLLDGLATVTLANPGDQLTLNFADVGTEPQAIPEPASFVIAASGIGLLVANRARKRVRRDDHDDN